MFKIGEKTNEENNLGAVIAADAFVSGIRKSGDIAGEYYSTDIHTILNGIEIDSINIGGRTLISAENMSYYSLLGLLGRAGAETGYIEEDHPITELLRL